MGKDCYELRRFNYEGSIQVLQSLNEVVVREKMKEMNPLLIHNIVTPELTVRDLVTQNPGYILRENEKMIMLEKCMEEEVSVYKSETLSRDFGYYERLSELGEVFESTMACHKRGYISLYKGYHTTEPSRCTHNVNLLGVLSGTTILYLINPKHEKDILGKSNQAIKKLCHRIILKPSSMCYLPPMWHYFYECKGETILYNYESDIYTTYLYNLLR